MTFRVFFNRCEDWPQVWSIDCGDVSTECNVIDWRIAAGNACAVYAGRAASIDAVDRAREPLAWACVEAHRLEIQQGVAVFYDAAT